MVNLGDKTPAPESVAVPKTVLQSWIKQTNKKVVEDRILRDPETLMWPKGMT